MFSAEQHNEHRFAPVDAMPLRGLFSVTVNFPLGETKQQTKGGSLPVSGRRCAVGNESRNETPFGSVGGQRQCPDAGAMRPQNGSSEASPGRQGGALAIYAETTTGKRPPFTIARLPSDVKTHIYSQGSRRGPTRAPGDPQAGWAKQLTEQHTKTAGCPRPDRRWYTPPVHPPDSLLEASSGLCLMRNTNVKRIANHKPARVMKTQRGAERAPRVASRAALTTRRSSRTVIDSDYRADSHGVLETHRTPRNSPGARRVERFVARIVGRFGLVAGNHFGTPFRLRAVGTFSLRRRPARAMVGDLYHFPNLLWLSLQPRRHHRPTPTPTRNRFNRSACGEFPPACSRTAPRAATGPSRFTR